MTILAFSHNSHRGGRNFSSNALVALTFSIDTKPPVTPKRTDYLTAAPFPGGGGDAIS
jgi:hypothetical protein